MGGVGSVRPYIVVGEEGLREEEDLREAQFLVVVCSPRTPGAARIVARIAGFLAFHGIERVIPVLLAADPASSFPLILSEVYASAGRFDLLAANLVAPTLRLSLRRLHLEKLRILAALYECEFDDLRQRERARRYRRVTVAASALAVPILLALGLRQGSLHFSTEKTRLLRTPGGESVVLRRGLPLLHPLLGSEELVIDSGFSPQELTAEGTFAVRTGRWCLPALARSPQSCSALLDRWSMPPLVEAWRRDPILFESSHLLALGPWMRPVTESLFADVEDCAAPGDAMYRSATTLLRLHADRARLLGACRRSLTCARPARAVEAAALLLELGGSEPAAVEVLQAKIAAAPPEAALAIAGLLGRHGLSDARVVRMLRQILNASERRDAALAGALLLRLDPEDRDAARVLWAAVASRNPSGTISIAGLETAVSLAPDLPDRSDPKVVKAWFRALDSPDHQISSMALMLLASLKVQDELMLARLREAVESRRNEIALMAAGKLIASSADEPRVIARLEEILGSTSEADTPPGGAELPFIRAAKTLRTLPGSRARVVAALRRHLGDSTPRAVLGAAELLIEEGETEGVPSALRALLPRVRAAELLSTAVLAARVPGKKEDFAKALEAYFQELQKPQKPWAGFVLSPPPPPGGPQPCDVAATLIELAEPSPEVVRYARQELETGDEACYARLFLVHAGENLGPAVDRLVATLGSPRAERSGAYRRAVSDALLLLAGDAPVNRPASTRVRAVRNALRPWLLSPLPHHRAEAAFVLARLEGFHLWPFIPWDKAPSP